MSKIEKTLMKVIEVESKRFSDDPVVKKFAKAEKEFTSLVEKGLAKRRGNQQMSLDQLQFRTYTFNTTQ